MDERVVLESKNLVKARGLSTLNRNCFSYEKRNPTETFVVFVCAIMSLYIFHQVVHSRFMFLAHGSNVFDVTSHAVISVNLNTPRGSSMEYADRFSFDAVDSIMDVSLAEEVGYPKNDFFVAGSEFQYGVAVWPSLGGWPMVAASLPIEVSSNIFSGYLHG